MKKQGLLVTLSAITIMGAVNMAHAMQNPQQMAMRLGRMGLNANPQAAAIIGPHGMHVINQAIQAQNHGMNPTVFANALNQGVPPDVIVAEAQHNPPARASAAVLHADYTGRLLAGADDAQIINDLAAGIGAPIGGGGPMPPPMHPGPVLGGPVGGPALGGPGGMAIGGPRGGGAPRGGPRGPVPPPMPGARGGGPRGGGGPVVPAIVLSPLGQLIRAAPTVGNIQDADADACDQAVVAAAGTIPARALAGVNAVATFTGWGGAQGNADRAIIRKVIEGYLERQALVALGGNANILVVYDAIEALGTPLAPSASSQIAQNAVAGHAAGNTQVQVANVVAGLVPGGLHAAHLLPIQNAVRNILFPVGAIVGVAALPVGTAIGGGGPQRIADIRATIAAAPGGAIQAAILADPIATAVHNIALAGDVAGGTFPALPANEAEEAAYAVLTAPPGANPAVKRTRAMDMVNNNAHRIPFGNALRAANGGPL